MMMMQYPLVCFDLDGTLVDDTIYIWNTLHEGFETNKVERDKAFADYFSGKITYEQWFQHDLKLLRAAGATRCAMAQMCQGLQVMNGAMETLHALRAADHRIAIISGSIQLVVETLFPNFEFDYMLINQVHFDTAGQISGGIHTPYDIEHKASGLRHLCALEKISPSQAVFVGDNDNDVWVAQEAGLALAFNCKSSRLAAVCDAEITTKDLQLVLPYLG